jgi:hypothetical protein
MTGLILAAVLAVGQTPEPTITVPAETRGTAGKLLVVEAQTGGKVVKWIPRDDGLDVFPAEFLKDSKTFAARAEKPGRYRVLALTALGDVPVYAETTLIFEGDAPPPPPPGPKPPIPPPPQPPVDDLARRCKEAYDADDSPGKRGQLVNLIGIYSAMAAHVHDDGIKTVRDLADVLAKVRAGMMQPGVLMDLRRLLDAELKSTLGAADSRPLDRDRAAALFQRIVAALPKPE